MKKIIIFMSGLIMALSLSAQSAETKTLSQQVFEDQHGAPLSLSVSTQWLIFAHDKQGGEWVKQALIELGIADLEARGGLYVADISGMPALIIKWFALPKAQSFPFRIAFDTSGELTADWPREDSTVSLMRLNSLNVTEQVNATSAEQIKAFLAAY